MSKMRSPSDRKPPLAELPNKLRPSRILRSSVHSTKPPLASVTRSQMVNRSWDVEESMQMRPEEQSISCELRALAKMVENEFGNREAGNTDFSTIACPNPSLLFERGRFYDEYSARRNERLKRKKCGETEEDSRRSVCDLDVALESGKRRDSKKYEKLRKSVPANFSIGGIETPRYSLRSSTKAKENMKPSIPTNAKRPPVGGDGDRKVVEVRRVRKT
ncbi:uncharacterized protein LOC122060056 [Macadamia integrifolia]|uniref:uncharacterized protein LOC122060056 n=1 Tax=Macadamia integrifolia TaxID=60698 RepID=UPI001C533431|nr:uncharacterized protein LOC122060056 [Macadamia integrifolia]